MSHQTNKDEGPPSKRLKVDDGAKVHEAGALPSQVNGSGSTTAERAATSRQVDANVLQFLTRILHTKQQQQKLASSTSSNAKAGANGQKSSTSTVLPKETVVRRKPAKEKRDVATQTDPIEEDEEEDEEEANDNVYDPATYQSQVTGGFVPNQAIYGDQSSGHAYSNGSESNWQQSWYNQSVYHEPQQGQQQALYDPSKSVTEMNSNQVKLEFDRWVKDYEKWFKDTFGDLRGLETPTMQQQEDQRKRLEAVKQSNQEPSWFTNESVDTVTQRQTVTPSPAPVTSSWPSSDTVTTPYTSTNQSIMSGGLQTPMSLPSQQQIDALQSSMQMTMTMPPPPSSSPYMFHYPMTSVPNQFTSFAVPHAPVSTAISNLATSRLVFSSASPTTMSSFTSGPLFMRPPPQPGLSIPLNFIPNNTQLTFMRPPSSIPFISPPPMLVPPMLIRIPMPPVMIASRPPMPPPPPPRGPPVRTSKTHGGPWGPLLRYGHYGAQRSFVEEIERRKQLYLKQKESEPEMESPSATEERAATSPVGITKTTGTMSTDIALVGQPLIPPTDEFVSMRVSEDSDYLTDKWVPPPQPPANIFMPKQALICTLQMRLRAKSHELAQREADPRLRLSLSYTNSLREVVQQGVGLPVLYLYTRIGKLPARERLFYSADGGSKVSSTGSNYPASVEALGFPETGEETTPLPGIECVEGESALARMYLCDLLIGDILISQGIGDWKRRARETAARQAFCILSQPSYVIGSTRLWFHTDYLVLGVSDGPRKVPVMPPFLSDPTEPLWKKDRYINEACPVENFELVNPKPIDELWLYIACGDSVTSPEQLLAQSAEFCQMMISYEGDVLPTGQFSVRVFVDLEVGAIAEGDTLPGARKLAASRLVDYLRKTQPQVGLLEGVREATGDALVESLMWGKSELGCAIQIEELGQHIDLPPEPEQSAPPTAPTSESPSDPLTSSDTVEPMESPKQQPYALQISRLERWVQAYAESAMITPLLVSQSVASDELWPAVRRAAANWGLMTQVHCSGLIVCKRIPMPRLKKTLLELGVCGVFVLKEKGSLSEETLARLEGVMPVLEEPEVGDDESGETRVEEEPQPDLRTLKFEPIDEDCLIMSAQLNSKNNPIEILDDLPKQMIPGIDF